MSNMKVLHISNKHQFNRGSGTDFNLQLLALKDLANYLLDQLNSVIPADSIVDGGTGNYLEKLNSGAGINYYHELQQFETELIRCALLLTNGKQIAAARLLGLNPTTLNAKIKHFNIPTRSIPHSQE